MQPMPARRLVNPRLGSYFAIFASAYAALVPLALIFEQLGADSGTVRWAIVLAPIALSAVIGVATATGEAAEYFAAGRRVPAVYVGSTLGVTAFGGTGLVAITGAFFLIGFDALCLAIGGLAGFVVMAILIAPFFRKFGAYTVPTYLGRRFENDRLRPLAALLLTLPLMLVLIAELRMAVISARFLAPVDVVTVVTIAAVAMLGTLLPGGVRGMTWVGMAQTIIVVLALLVPVTIVAIELTNLPLPHLSQGPMMRQLARLEAQGGLPIVIAPGLAFDMPGTAPIGLDKRYAAPFGAIGPHGFVTAMLTIMMGVAVAPWLLPRVATAPGVYHARKTLGWATLVFGVVMLTIAAVAIFTRSLLITGVAAGNIPDWVRILADAGLATVQPRVGPADPSRPSALGQIAIARDAVLMALPLAAGYTSTFVAVAVGGVFAACLLGASAAATALAAMLAEDGWHGRRKEPPSDAVRIATMRGAFVLVVAAAAVTAAVLPVDPLTLLLWALALTGSTLFPVLVLSIWWKRMTGAGAAVGLFAGFMAALLAIVTGTSGVLAIDPALAGMFGIPASLLATVLVSLMTRVPSPQVLELVSDIRVPGGEILYDREMRLQRLKTRQRTTEP